ncbi:hypothetical protein F5883DRAFT_664745, partial [Diaporthe sp. PMI_573]
MGIVCPSPAACLIMCAALGLLARSARSKCVLAPHLVAGDSAGQLRVRLGDRMSPHRLHLLVGEVRLAQPRSVKVRCQRGHLAGRRGARGRDGREVEHGGPAVEDGLRLLAEGVTGRVVRAWHPWWCVVVVLCVLYCGGRGDFEVSCLVLPVSCWAWLRVCVPLLCVVDPEAVWAGLGVVCFARHIFMFVCLCVFSLRAGSVVANDGFKVHGLVATESACLRGCQAALVGQWWSK